MSNIEGVATSFAPQKPVDDAVMPEARTEAAMSRALVKGTTFFTPTP